ncbi:MAG: hypothetical protein AABX13_05485 [Nanoarchaeota archaeon]
MLNKKGMEQMWWIIMVAAIGLIVVILVLLWFKGAGGKGFDFLGGKIGEFEDCDQDKVSDFFDTCVCTAALGTSAGCPEGKTADPAEKKKPECCIKR